MASSRSLISSRYGLLCEDQVKGEMMSCSLVRAKAATRQGHESCRSSILLVLYSTFDEFVVEIFGSSGDEGFGTCVRRISLRVAVQITRSIKTEENNTRRFSRACLDNGKACRRWPIKQVSSCATVEWGTGRHASYGEEAHDGVA